MSITRIQNNQITDSTIVAYAKLQSGSLTGNLFAPTLTLNSNVTINGNLFLANTGNTAIINATNTYINDPIVVYNNGYVGSLSGYDIGMLINRNLTSLANYGSVNTAWVWSENDGAFVAIATTDVGTGSASINNSGWANTKVGNSVVVGTQTISGALISGPIQATSIGATTPGSAAFTTLTASGITQITNATNNTGLAYNNGALQVSGGAGFASNVFVGGNLIVSGNVFSSTGNVNVVNITGTSGQFFGNAAGFGALYAGIASGYVYQPQTVLQNSTNFNGYAQLNHQNINAGGDATTDYVVTADNGTESTYYLDMGITSSGYDNTTPTNALGTSVFPNDSYLYAQGKTGFAGGNLTVGTTVAGTVMKMLVGGINSSNVVGTFTTSGLTVNAATSSSSTTSGALVVAGGAGIAGAVYAGSVYDNGNRVLTSLSSSGAGNLTVSISAPASSTIALPQTGPGAAIWGGPTQLHSVTTDAYGRVVSASNIALNTVAVTQAGNTANITANSATGLVGFDLTSTGVTPGQYGSTTVIPVITVDNKGRVTALTTSSVATSFTIAGTSGTATVAGGSTLTLAGTYGVTVAVGTEYANIATPQDLRTTANPSFNNLTSASFQGVIGNATPNTAQFTTVDATTLRAATIGNTGATLTGTLSTAAQTNVTSLGTLTGLTVSGATALNTVTGASFQGVIGNVAPTSAQFTTVDATTLRAATIGNASASLLGTIGTAAQPNITSVGNLTSLSVAGVTTSWGNIVAASGTASTNTTTGALVVIGGAGISGALYTGSTATHAGNVAITSGGGLTTTQTTGYLFNETATTLNIGSAATALNMGAGSGTATIANPTVTLTNATALNINGASPSIVTSSTGTASVFNTNATTLNIGGAATTISIGASTGNTTVNSANLVVSGNLFVTGTTTTTYINREVITGAEVVAGLLAANSGAASTSTTTGALIVTGGAGISGAVYAGSFQGAIGTVAPNTGNFTTIDATTVRAATIGNVGATIVGSLTGASVTGTVATANVSLYDSVTAYTTNQSFYPVFSNISVTGNTSQGVSSNFSFNPSTGALSATSFNGVGTFSTATTSGTLIASGNIVAAASTASTSTTTGALVAPNGGIGATGNLNVGAAGTSIHQVFGNLAVGYNSTPGIVPTTLVVNQNNAALFNSTSALHVFAAQETTGKISLDSVGTNRPSIFIARTASGTAASPAAAQSGQTLGGFIMRGYGTTGFNLASGVNSSGILAYATQTFTDTAQGTQIKIATTPNNSNAAIIAATFDQDQSATFAANTTVTGNLTVIQNATLNSNLTVANYTTLNGITSITRFTTISGVLRVANSTATTSSTTGAIVVDGGVAVFGNINTAGQLFVGAQSQNTQLTGALVVERGTSSTGAGTQYTQHAIINGTNTGSSDFIAYANNYPGTANDHGWADVGFTGDAFNDAAYSITKPNDGYLFASAANSSVGGNLVLATDYTGNYNDIVIGVGSFYSNSEVARFHGNTSNNGYLNLQYTTSASSTTTGALRVAGGAGIAGAVYASSFQGVIGNVAPAAATFTSATIQQGLQNTIIGNATPSSAQFTSVDAVILRAATVGNVGSALVGTISTAAQTNITSVGTLTGLTVSGATSLNTVTGASFQGVIGNVAPAAATFTTATIQQGIQNTPIGNATASTGAFTTLSTSGVTTHAGNVVVTSGVDTTSTTTGALMLTGTGGLMVGGNAYVGNNMYVGSSALAQQVNFANPAIIAVDNGSNYAQIALKNTNANGSADYAAYGDTGTDASGWADMGFAGSTFNDGNYTITKPNDGYFFVKPTSNSYGGNLILATSEFGSFNDVVVGVGSFHANAEVARFHGNVSSSGYLNLAYTTNLSGPGTANSGALRVQGGASFGGNVYMDDAVIINGSQASSNDFKVCGVNTTNLIWARPNTTYDTVVIGNTIPASSLVNGAKLYINSTDSMIIPTGTSAQRPGSTGGTDTVGMLRYNTTSNGLEFYNGSSWQAPSSTITVITDQQFTATGSTAAFTLSAAATTASTIVSINGVLQIPTLAYSVSGTTLTFTENPVAGDIIDVRALTTTSTVSQLNDVSGFNSIQTLPAGSTNGAAAILFTTGLIGGSSVSQYSIDTSGGFVTLSPNVTVASSGSATTVDFLYANTYSSAEYTITSTMQNTNVRQIDKVHLIHSGDATGAGTAFVTVYGTVNTAGNSLVSYTATTSGNVVLLQATTTNNNTLLRIKRNYQAI